MRSSPTSPQGGPPGWLLLAGSLVLVYHLVSLGVAALDVPSGPWPGTGFVMAPPFIRGISSPAAWTHVRLLKIGHGYRFFSNRPGTPEATFEVRFKDEQGQPLRDRRGDPVTRTFPEKETNPWVKHRQRILTRQLADDLPVSTGPGEIIPAAGQKVPEVDIWEPVGERQLRLKTVPRHLVSREREIMGPSEWEMILVRSYARYLCREQGAASAEVVRRTRLPVPPQVLMDNLPSLPFQDLVAHYGEVAR